MLYVPLSMKPSPLTELGDYSYKTILQDDYQIEYWNLKAKLNSICGGAANFKFTPNTKENHQEIKIQFPYRKLYFWLGTRPTDIKIHVDLGQFDMFQKQNIFFNIRHGKGKELYKIGSVFKDDKLVAHTRLSTDANQVWNLLQKSVYTDKECIYSSVQQYNIKTGTFSKYDYLFGYLTKNTDLFLKHHSQGVPYIPLMYGYGIGRVAANIIYRQYQTTLAAEISYDGPQNIGLVVAVGTEIDQDYIKAKVNVRDKNMNLALKRKINENFGFTLASELSIVRQVQSTVLTSKIGGSLEINI